MDINTLQKEMIAAMKSGDKFRKTTISGIVAQIKKTAIDKGCRDNISEEMVNAELIKIQKITQEMIDTCPVSRTDLLEDYKKQMEIVCEFAPTLISNQDEIAAILTNSGIEFIKSNRGVIMKWLKTNYGGKMDMGAASKVVGGMLQ